MNEQFKEKYLELQMLNSQLQQLQQQIQTADAQSAEMAKIAISVEDAKSIEKGQELLVPLGQGIFIKAKAEENKNVIMSVGADVVVEKSLDDALEVVKRQNDELNTIIFEMKQEFSNGVQKMHEMQHELSQLEAESKKTPKKK